MKEKTPNFSEREGLKPLPDAYRLGELSYEVRNELKYIFTEMLNKFVGFYRGEEPVPDWHKIFKDFHIRFLELQIEVFHPENTRSQVFGLISVGSYNDTLDTLEFFINHPLLIAHSLSNEVSDLFERRQVAYILVERDKNRRFFVPRASKEEGIVYLGALESLTSAQFGGARKNLTEAGYYLAKKEHSKSVRESIHAIESIIRVLTENKSIKFSDGMRELNKKFALHPALGEGLIKLYGFASDEDGVRHSSIQGTENIDEETAFCFLGLCASFITFLTHKARKRNLKEEQKKLDKTS